MYYKYNTKIGTLEAPFPINLGALGLMTYEHFNQNNIESKTALPQIFKNTIEVIEKYYGINSEHSYFEYPFDIHTTTFNKNVLLACTGGLDSTYQAIFLKEKGYNVTLFYMCEDNTKGEASAVINLANELILPRIRCNFIHNNDYTTDTFQNLVFYSLMIDCCQAENIYYISSGNDATLDLYDITLTKNLNKARQITDTFFNDLYLRYSFSIIPAHKTTKLEKLRKLKNYSLLDTYYSCNYPSKINKINRNQIQTKFGIKLGKHNCGKCEKCALYNLLYYYHFNYDFTDDFIDYCWDIMSSNPLFSPYLDFDTKLKNLNNC